MSDQSTSVEKTLGDHMTTVLHGLLEGAAADIEQYARTISASMVVAVQRNDTQRVAELKAQLRALAEVNKIRAKQGAQDVAWGTIGAMLDLTFGVVTQALKSA